MELLATADSQFDLGLAILDVHGHGNDGEPFDFCRLSELSDLGLIQEQAALSLGFVVVDVALLVGFDVAIYQRDFAIGNDGECTIERDVVLLYRLDFGAFKDNTGFECFEDFVLETGFAVLAYDLIIAHSE